MIKRWLKVTVVVAFLLIPTPSFALNCEVTEVDHRRDSGEWVTGVVVMCGLWQTVYITPWPPHEAYPGRKVSVDIAEDGGMRLSDEQPPPSELKRTEYECKQRGLYCRLPVN